MEILQQNGSQGELRIHVHYSVLIHIITARKFSFAVFTNCLCCIGNTSIHKILAILLTFANPFRSRALGRDTM